MIRSVIKAGFSLIALTVSATAFAQAADMASTASTQAKVRQEWVARYNGPGNSADVPHALAVDGQGNVYVTGWSRGNGTEYDYATLKYNRHGKLLWARRYNGPGNNYDSASVLAVDRAGNVYVTGDSVGSGTDYDYATLKYDRNGNLLWEQRYNGPENSSDGASALAVDGRGNLYVTGTTVTIGSDGYARYNHATLKYGSDGRLLWAQRYNGPSNGDDDAYALAVDGRGNVYVTGWSQDISGYPLNEYLTLKYDANGALRWEQRYGRSVTRAQGNALTVDERGNIYVTGGTEGDYATLKYDTNGTLQWAQRYNGPENAYDDASAIAVDRRGNVYVTGLSLGSVANSDDYATIKYSQRHGQQNPK